MKYILYTLLLIGLVACSGEGNSTKKSEKPENLIEIKDGVYKEFYPGKKHIKISGPVGENNSREGKWVFYGDNGEELSICFYEKGNRHGHSIVKYPNGAIRYVGEYINDKQAGVWEFYDEKGNIIKTVDYGTPE